MISEVLHLAPAPAHAQFSFNRSPGGAGRRFASVLFLHFSQEHWQTQNYLCPFENPKTALLGRFYYDEGGD